MARADLYDDVLVGLIEAKITPEPGDIGWRTVRGRPVYIGKGGKIKFGSMKFSTGKKTGFPARTTPTGKSKLMPKHEGTREMKVQRFMAGGAIHIERSKLVKQAQEIQKGLQTVAGHNRARRMQQQLDAINKRIDALDVESRGLTPKKRELDALEARDRRQRMKDAESMRISDKDAKAEAKASNAYAAKLKAQQDGAPTRAANRRAVQKAIASATPAQQRRMASDPQFAKAFVRRAVGGSISGSPSSNRAARLGPLPKPDADGIEPYWTAPKRKIAAIQDAQRLSAKMKRELDAMGAGSPKASELKKKLAANEKLIGDMYWLLGIDIDKKKRGR